MKDDHTLVSESAQIYKGAAITNIRRGKGERKKYIYADIRAADGTLLVSADLSYCTKRMEAVTLFF